MDLMIELVSIGFYKRKRVNLVMLYA